MHISIYILLSSVYNSYIKLKHGAEMNNKFKLMKKQIELREKVWNTKFSFFGKLNGYVQMGLFISSDSIDLANKGLEHQLTFSK